MIKIIKGIKVEYNKETSEEELELYVDYFKKNFPNSTRSEIILNFLDNGEVDLGHYEVVNRFERIRRITGYLVGTTDRWNNAKQDELKHRVKHGNNTKV